MTKLSGFHSVLLLQNFADITHLPSVATQKRWNRGLTVATENSSREAIVSNARLLLNLDLKVRKGRQHEKRGLLLFSNSSSFPITLSALGIQKNGLKCILSILEMSDTETQLPGQFI
jgi:hypothetical protein